MAQFKNSVITEKGLALLQKVQQRTLKLTYTQITTGAGEYTGTEDLSGATALKDQRQSVQISSISAVNSITVKLVAVISNTGLEQGYRITEVGIWAKDPDEGDILFSLAVAEPNGADYIPAETGGSISMNFEMYQTVNASAAVNIQPGTGAYASAVDLAEFKEQTNKALKSVTTVFEMMDKIPEMHRNIFRGKNLGNVLDYNQLAEISGGTFHDLWVGDYWNLGGVKWRIVDIDYWQDLTEHHVLVMPDDPLSELSGLQEGTTPMGVSSSTFGYGASVLNSVLNSNREYFINLFENYIFTRPGVKYPKLEGEGWKNVESTYTDALAVDIPTDIMMFGCSMFTNDNTKLLSTHWAGVSYVQETSQLALMKLDPKKTKSTRNYWLRNFIYTHENEMSALYVTDDGFVAIDTATSATAPHGVRPIVAIGDVYTE